MNSELAQFGWQTREIILNLSRILKSSFCVYLFGLEALAFPVQGFSFSFYRRFFYFCFSAGGKYRAKAPWFFHDRLPLKLTRSLTRNVHFFWIGKAIFQIPFRIN
ncbi:MAG: hypothetical protein D6714_16115 [Bacteroidetes bacterium]|nr:MAG: hypothetical protein D6714_16115 [Bacteroidota bacterium]